MWHTFKVRNGDNFQVTFVFAVGNSPIMQAHTLTQLNGKGESDVFMLLSVAGLVILVHLSSGWLVRR